MYHFIHARVAKIKKTMASIGEAVEKSEPSHTAGGMSDDGVTV